MFSKKKIILSFSKTTITVTQVTLSNPPQIKHLMDIPWTPGELSSILTTIKKTAGNRFRVLLSEELVYVVSLSIPSSSLTRIDIQTQAQELIPEDLANTAWDFKALLIEEKNPTQLVQVVAITQSFFEQFSEAAQKTKIEIEAIEPISYALARLVMSEPKPLVIVYIEHTTLLVMVYKGLVIATEVISEGVQTKHIDALIRFAQNRFTPSAEKMIFSGNIDTIDIKQFTVENRTTETRILHPTLGLALKTDIIGKDELVLNLAILKAKPVRQPVNKLLLILLIFVLIFGSLTIAVILKGKTAIKQVPTRPTPTIVVTSPSPQLTATQITISAHIDLSTYRIEILNGSGKEGEAGNVRTILTGKGFTITKIGNAQNADYQDTVIRTKQQVNPQYLKKLEEILGDIYTLKKGDTITENETIDVSITIGKKRAV